MKQLCVCFTTCLTLITRLTHTKCQRVIQSWCGLGMYRLVWRRINWLITKRRTRLNLVVRQLFHWRHCKDYTLTTRLRWRTHHLRVTRCRRLIRIWAVWRCYQMVATLLRQEQTQLRTTSVPTCKSLMSLSLTNKVIQSRDKTPVKCQVLLIPQLIRITRFKVGRRLTIQSATSTTLMMLMVSHHSQRLTCHTHQTHNGVQLMLRTQLHWERKTSRRQW